MSSARASKNFRQLFSTTRSADLEVKQVHVILGDLSADKRYLSKLVTPVNGALPYASILDFSISSPSRFNGWLYLCDCRLIDFAHAEPNFSSRASRPTGGRVLQSRRDPGPESVSVVQ